MGKSHKKGNPPPSSSSAAAASSSHASDRQKRQALRKQRHQAVSKRNGNPELVQFTHQLRLHRLALKSITGDGNCLFRAFADQLYGDEHASYASLRSRACNEILSHRDDYAPFIIAENEDTEEISFDEYMEDMQYDGTWGGNLEIQALSKACQVNVCIHQVNEPVWNVINYPPSLVRTVHLAYQGGQHYDSVRNENDVYSNDPPTPIELAMVVTGNSGKKGNTKTSTVEISSLSSSASLHPSEKQVWDAFPNPSTRPSLETIQQALKDCHFDTDATIEYLLCLGNEENNNNNITIPTNNTVNRGTTNGETNPNTRNRGSTAEKITTISSPSSSDTVTNNTETVIPSVKVTIVTTTPAPEPFSSSSSSSTSTLAHESSSSSSKGKSHKDNSGPRRNGPCPCGSHKLYRKCCESIDKAKQNKDKFTGGGSSSAPTSSSSATEKIQIVGVQI